jgi:multisubunit Na+/H+ antiporter MnhG subunit
MAGWIVFAAIMMIIVGILLALQGLVALLDDDYYQDVVSTTVTDNLTTWGWVLLIWGVVVVIAGWALFQAKEWARWVAILAVSVNMLLQLGFDGKAGGWLWSFCVIVLDIIILYALLARWEESKAEMFVEEGPGPQSPGPQGPTT